MEDKDSTWNKIMAMKAKDTRHKGVANTLTDDELQTIVGTIDYFGGSTGQAMFDLVTARYRVFDFLAMCVMGDRCNSTDATKVLAYSFLKNDGDIDKFIDDLRVTDYDINHEWETVRL